jgi:hypothetical protein
MRLATDPDFFCEIIRLVFRSANSTDPKPSEDERGVATNAYRLLHEWKIPPGTTSDGGFDGDKFGTWIKSVKLECSASGHLAPALNMIGQVLTHAPKDSDGLWIHRAVAMALNARDAESMRNGFRTALYNARGAHWVDPTGNPERELSLQYTTKADLIEQTGFHRLAETLRELANVYQTEAERIVARSSEEHLD